MICRLIFFGCIFYEKFENLNLRVAAAPFTPEIVSILNACKVLENSKNKQEIISDLLFTLAPLLDRSCSWNSIIQYTIIRNLGS